MLKNCALENLDFLAITETWLTDTDKHIAWIVTNQLEGDKHSFQTHNQLGLLHRKEYQVTKLDNPLELDTMEYVI